MNGARIASLVDMDSVDSFRPCANPACPNTRPDPDSWPYARVIDDAGVRLLCRTCTFDATKPAPRRMVTLDDGRTVPADVDGRPLWLADGGWYD